MMRSAINRFGARSLRREGFIFNLRESEKSAEGQKGAV
jgi:hypothetical protein